jgi:hypothetical protein
MYFFYDLFRGRESFVSYVAFFVPSCSTDAKVLFLMSGLFFVPSCFAEAKVLFLM